MRCNWFRFEYKIIEYSKKESICAQCTRYTHGIPGKKKKKMQKYYYILAISPNIFLIFEDKKPTYLVEKIPFSKLQGIHIFKNRA